VEGTSAPGEKPRPTNCRTCNRRDPKPADAAHPPANKHALGEQFDARFLPRTAAALERTTSCDVSSHSTDEKIGKFAHAQAINKHQNGNPSAGAVAEHMLLALSRIPAPPGGAPHGLGQHRVARPRYIKTYCSQGSCRGPLSFAAAVCRGAHAKPA